MIKYSIYRKDTTKKNTSKIKIKHIKATSVVLFMCSEHNDLLISLINLTSCFITLTRLSSTAHL
jgi:hypothetical protein